MLKRFAICAMLTALASCGITFAHKEAVGLREANRVSIVRNKDVDGDFIIALMAWMRQNGHEFDLVDEYRPVGWVIRYSASWSWDFVFYLSTVRVRVDEDGVERGFGNYHVNGGAFSLDPEKWSKDFTVVNKLMWRVYGAPGSKSQRPTVKE